MQAFNHTFRRTASGLNLYYAWFEAMHSRMDIFLEGLDESAAGVLTGSICDEVGRLDDMLDRFDSQSEVYKINNRNALGGYTAGGEITEIFAGALRYRDLTLGEFDICIQTPDFMPMTGYYSVTAEVLNINRDDAVFDFGGYAKGYALEKVRDMVAAAGVKNALLSFGNSSVYAMGRHPLGNEWEVGVEDPDNKAASLVSLKLKDSALSASGNTARNRAHIKSPHTGMWNADNKIIAVTGGSPLDCEVLSTAVFAAASPERRSAVMENFEGCRFLEFDLG